MFSRLILYGLFAFLPLVSLRSMGDPTGGDEGEVEQLTWYGYSTAHFLSNYCCGEVAGYCNLSKTDPDYKFAYAHEESCYPCQYAITPQALEEAKAGYKQKIEAMRREQERDMLSRARGKEYAKLMASVQPPAVAAKARLERLPRGVYGVVANYLPLTDVVRLGCSSKEMLKKLRGSEQDLETTAAAKKLLARSLYAYDVAAISPVELERRGLVADVLDRFGFHRQICNEKGQYINFMNEDLSGLTAAAFQEWLNGLKSLCVRGINIFELTPRLSIGDMTVSPDAIVDVVLQYRPAGEGINFQDIVSWEVVFNRSYGIRNLRKFCTDFLRVSPHQLEAFLEVFLGNKKNHFCANSGKSATGKSMLAMIAKSRDIPADLAIRLMAFLIHKGAQINAVDQYGNTALMDAISSRDPAIVTWLLEQPGINVHNDQAGSRRGITGTGGDSALILAMVKKAPLAIVEKLLALGADVHAPNHHGQSALTLAQGGAYGFPPGSKPRIQQEVKDAVLAYANIPVAAPAPSSAKKPRIG